MLGMELNAEIRQGLVHYTLIRLVVLVVEEWLPVVERRRYRLGIHCVSVVLAGDVTSLRAHQGARLILAAVAVLHFRCLEASGK